MVLPVLADLLMKRITIICLLLLSVLTVTADGGGKQIFFVVVAIEGGDYHPDTTPLGILEWHTYTWHNQNGKITYNPDNHVYYFRPNGDGVVPPWGGSATFDADGRLRFVSVQNGHRVVYVLARPNGWRRLCPLWPLC